MDGFKGWLVMAGVGESGREASLKAIARAWRHLDEEDMGDPMALDLYRRSLTPALRRSFDLGWAHYRSFARDLGVEGLAEPPRLSPVRFPHPLSEELLWASGAIDIDKLPGLRWGYPEVADIHPEGRLYLARAYEWQTGLSVPRETDFIVPKRIDGPPVPFWALDYAMRSVDRMSGGPVEQMADDWLMSAAQKNLPVPATRRVFDWLVAERQRIQRTRLRHTVEKALGVFCIAGDPEPILAVIAAK
jgi:hypothetical protein